MSFNYSPKIVTDGLVLCLDAANTKSYVSGSTAWNDLSRGGNNGTLINGPTFNTGSLGSITFDGINDYATIPSNTLFNSVSSGFSLGCWVNISATQPSVDSQIIGTLFNEVSGYGILYDFPLKKRFNFYIRSANRVSSTTDLTPNIWYHVMCVYTGTLDIIYVNGRFNNQVSDTTAPLSTTPFVIGTYSTGIQRSFAGRISQVLSYNKALSSQEVLQNYNATKSRYGL
jgi:hypothetical protein